MRKLFKTLLAILALALVCTTGFAQTGWPPWRVTTTIGPQDFWYFYTPLCVSELYVAGTTGSNGTIYINGFILPAPGTIVLNNQMGFGAIWDTNLNQWVFAPTSSVTTGVYELVVGTDTTRFEFISGYLTSLKTNGVEIINP